MMEASVQVIRTLFPKRPPFWDEKAPKIDAFYIGFNERNNYFHGPNTLVPNTCDT